MRRLGAFICLVSLCAVSAAGSRVAAMVARPPARRMACLQDSPS